MSASVFRSKKREPPIAIYLGNFIQIETRKSGVVDKLCKLGLSISSDRVDFISKSLGNRAIEQFEQNDVVYPINMQPNRFTIGAVDNIDIDPSSTTAMSAFHGTAASLHQKVIFEEEETTHDLAPLPDGKFLKKLPSSYTDIEPVYLPSTVNPTCNVKADQSLIERQSPMLKILNG